MITETKTTDTLRERCFRAFRDGYTAMAKDPILDTLFEEDIDRAVGICDVAGVDAVLAVLEPWLMPELPDDVGWIGLDVYRRGSSDKSLRGVGPTIPAAIRDALEGGHR